MILFLLCPLSQLETSPSSLLPSSSPWPLVSSRVCKLHAGAVLKTLVVLLMAAAVAPELSMPTIQLLPA